MKEKIPPASPAQKEEALIQESYTEFRAFGCI